MDNKGRPTILNFNLVEGDSPLIIGLYTKQYTDTLNKASPRRVIFKPPCDMNKPELYTYISEDDTGCERLRIEIVPHDRTTVLSLMWNIVKGPEIYLVKKIHRFTHAPAEEMKALFKDAGMATAKLDAACDKNFGACEIYVSSEEPKQRKKISLTHVNNAFNEDLTADFVIVHIRGEKCEVHKIVDAGTRYGERAIAASRNSTCMQLMLETEFSTTMGPQGRSALTPSSAGQYSRNSSTHTTSSSASDRRGHCGRTSLSSGTTGSPERLST